VQVPESDKDNYSLAYSELVVPLIKDMQEQQAQIKHLENENKIKETVINNIQHQLAAQNLSINELKKMITELSELLKRPEIKTN
jgi:uncharacterized coiled-coil protein SlyX